SIRFDRRPVAPKTRRTIRISVTLSSRRPREQPDGRGALSCEQCPAEPSTPVQLPVICTPLSFRTNGIAALTHHIHGALRIGRVMTFRFLIAICSLAAAGCAVQKTTPTETPTVPATVATPAPAQAPALPASPPAATEPEIAATPPAAQAPAAEKPAPPAPKPAPSAQAAAPT